MSLRYEQMGWSQLVFVRKEVVKDLVFRLFLTVSTLSLFVFAFVLMPHEFSLMYASVGAWAFIVFVFFAHKTYISYRSFVDLGFELDIRKLESKCSE